MYATRLAKLKRLLLKIYYNAVDENELTINWFERLNNNPDIKLMLNCNRLGDYWKEKCLYTKTKFDNWIVVSGYVTNYTGNIFQQSANNIIEEVITVSLNNNYSIRFDIELSSLDYGKDWYLLK